MTVEIEQTKFTKNDNSEVMPEAYLFKENSVDDSLISVSLKDSTLERNIGTGKIHFPII